MSKKKRKKSRKQPKKLGFWLTLEKYSYLRIARLPVKWEWVGLAIILLAITVSVISGYFKSSTLFGGQKEVIKWAASAGDYTTAEKLYQETPTVAGVLGRELELEGIVYPERKIWNEIVREQELLLQYPGSRDILIRLSELYRELGERERAQAYRELARELDPNNPLFANE